MARQDLVASFTTNKRDCRMLEVPGQYAGCGGGAGTRAALAGTAPDPERHARVLR